MQIIFLFYCLNKQILKLFKTICSIFIFWFKKQKYETMWLQTFIRQCSPSSTISKGKKLCFILPLFALRPVLLPENGLNPIFAQLFCLSWKLQFVEILSFKDSRPWDQAFSGSAAVDRASIFCLGYATSNGII